MVKFQHPLLLRRLRLFGTQEYLGGLHNFKVFLKWLMQTQSKQFLKKFYV